jgi:hypothetical protein
MTVKHICWECKWRGTSDDWLVAKNPFNNEDTILGCPQCFDINTLYMACDEPECWKPASCGTPTENGYRNTCGEHRPKEDK